MVGAALLRGMSRVKTRGIMQDTDQFSGIGPVGRATHETQLTVGNTFNNSAVEPPRTCYKLNGQALACDTMRIKLPIGASSQLTPWNQRHLNPWDQTSLNPWDQMFAAYVRNPQQSSFDTLL